MSGFPTVYVSNLESLALDSRTIETELFKLFSDHIDGSVRSVKVADERESNRVWRFAFVEITDASDIAVACELLNGVEFHGRRLFVRPFSNLTRSTGA